MRTEETMKTAPDRREEEAEGRDLPDGTASTPGAETRMWAYASALNEKHRLSDQSHLGRYSEQIDAEYGAFVRRGIAREEARLRAAERELDRLIGASDEMGGPSPRFEVPFLTPREEAELEYPHREPISITRPDVSSCRLSRSPGRRTAA